METSEIKEIKSMRPLAVITGASDGMGREFARALAGEKCDLWLIARREKKLEELKNELESLHGISVEIFPRDISLPENIHFLEERIEKAENLFWMINCAGFASGEGIFPDVNIEIETRMLMVHNMAPMRFCRAALIPMRAAGRGFIINVASVGGFLASRGGVDYESTKAFLISFSRGLQCDCVGTGVQVQVLCPGFVRTGFHDSETMQTSTLKQQVPGWMWDEAPNVVRKSLKAMRKNAFRPVVFIPGFFYRLVALATSMPLLAPFRILFSGGKMR